MAIAAGRVAAWAVGRVTSANHVVDLCAYPDRTIAVDAAKRRAIETAAPYSTLKVFALVEVDEP